MGETQRGIMKVRKLVRTAARTHKKEVREREGEEEGMREKKGGTMKEKERVKNEMF